MKTLQYLLIIFLFCFLFGCSDSGGISGFMSAPDSTGQLVIFPQFDDVTDFNDGFARVKIGDKWGFMDSHGKMVIKPRFIEAQNFRDGLAQVKEEGRNGLRGWMFIDKRGKEIIHDYYHCRDWTGENIDSDSDTYQRGFSEGLAAIGFHSSWNSEPAKWGFIDKEGAIVIKPQFDSVEDFSEGLAAVRIGNEETGKWGYINKKGDIVIIPIFKKAGSFFTSSKSFFFDKIEAVVNDSIRIDKQGERVPSDIYYPPRINENKYGLHTTGLSMVLDPILEFGDAYERIDKAEFHEGYVSDGYLLSRRSSLLGFYKVEEMTPCRRRMVIFGTDRGGLWSKWGYLRWENVVIEYQFDAADYFSEGLAAVRIGDEITGKWGFINSDGKMIIKPQFDAAGYFSEGLAAVRIGDKAIGKWGYINTDGKMIIKPQFDDVKTFYGKFAQVKIAGKWGFISRGPYNKEVGK